jgi:GPH family glycoside/pentoside/hexuronide:cation symporter
MSGAFVETLDTSAPVDETRPEHRDLPTSTMLLYGTGQVGAQVFRDAPATLLPIFLTTMLGVPAWIAGLSILLPKLWVIFCDPLMGAFSDRKKMTWGRIPFLFTGAILTALCFFLLFSPPEFPSFWMSAAYNTVMFTIASTAFSIFSVPYLAMASEMSKSYHERTKIMAFRLVFTALGVLIGVGFVQPLVRWFGGGRHGYTMMALSLAGLCLAAMMTTVIGMRRFRLIQTASEHIPIFAQFRMAATYNWFALLGGSHFLQQLGQACNYTVVGLVFIYAVDNIALLIPFVLVMTIGSIVSQPAWLVVSRRIGKRPTYVMCVTVWALVNLSWVLVHPATDELFRLPLFGAVSTQTVLIMLRGVFIGPFNAGFVLMSYSLLTDTIEYDRRRFGISREGAFSGIYSALEKLAFAVGPAVAGVILSLTGFSESKGGEAIQSSGAIHGILIVFGFVPTFFAMSSLLLLRLYKLDERTILATRPA